MKDVWKTIDIPETIDGIRDGVNMMREIYPARKLVIAMPTWLYNEIDHMKCDGNRANEHDEPTMFGIRVKTIKTLDSVFVGREVRL